MKSKLLILTVAVAILGSFAFMSFDKVGAKTNVEVNTTQQHSTLQGITKEDASF